ncbi:type II toxin-antitoxin system PemK/MazF family toxin [Gallintestinimicrobium propionicum]|uniref:mRNA interferase n=1 Tax=Gallintestinimicrobium propionicum TaxID=2981770 RepID=A0AAE3AVV0_9FIRM|nr:type II toxin-antitoxin system PemK/MazF family toxin [Gallintestinimicrobium propionicum]MCC2168808.1 type II toxin-antitoxin system PemK/MazF family toxin [Gallintestinimicrobium propionicum]
MRKNWIYRRGDIYFANLNPFRGSEQGGTRPVLVLQNDTGNFFCPTLIVAPLTTKVYKKQTLPTHFVLKHVKGLGAESIVLLEQIKTIDKSRILNYVGKVLPSEMNGVDEAMRISLGISVPEGADVRTRN